MNIEGGSSVFPHSRFRLLAAERSPKLPTTRKELAFGETPTANLGNAAAAVCMITATGSEVPWSTRNALRTEPEGCYIGVPHARATEKHPRRNFHICTCVFSRCIIYLWMALLLLHLLRRRVRETHHRNDNDIVYTCGWLAGWLCARPCCHQMSARRVSARHYGRSTGPFVRFASRQQTERQSRLIT